MVGAQLLQTFSFFAGACDGDDFGAHCLRKLQRKHADAACALGQQPLTCRELSAWLTEQRIPRSDASAGERCSFKVAQTLGHLDKTLLVKRAIRAQCPVDGSAETRVEPCSVNRACHVLLVERGYNLVSNLKPGHAGANCNNYTSAIRSGHHVGLLREWVLSQRDDDIAKL